MNTIKYLCKLCEKSGCDSYLCPDKWHKTPENNFVSMVGLNRIDIGYRFTAMSKLEGFNRSQLAKLGELLVWAFQEDNLPSRATHDELVDLKIKATDDDVSFYCLDRQNEAISHSIMLEQ